MPLLRHLKGLRTVEGVVLENKADSGRISLFPGWEPFILPYLWIKGLTGDPRVFSRIAAGFLSYDGEAEDFGGLQ